MASAIKYIRYQFFTLKGNHYQGKNGKNGEKDNMKYSTIGAARRRVGATHTVDTSEFWVEKQVTLQSLHVQEPIQ